MPEVQSSHRPQISPLAAWIFFCVFCNCVGWTLCAIHQLNTIGYAVAFTIGLVVAGVWKILTRASFPAPNFQRLRKRFRRAFPLAFLVLATLAILGGVLYPPTNADALTQRIPRLLNWFAEGHWFWISNSPHSFNTRSIGFEWLMAPFIALLKTDREIFLLNAVSYLFFPGLIFGVLTRLGVRKRVAWHWMWLAPTGYCFLVQAGSIGNDAIGAMFVLAALDYALRAREKNRISDFWLSILAAALMTGMKTSNLTLLLPWAIAILPSVKLVARRPLSTAVIGILAVVASFFPVAVLNYKYTRDWTGMAYEMAEAQHLNPAVAFAGNAMNLTAQNFVPPIFPMADWWNEHFYRLLPQSLIAKMEASFEQGGAHVKVMEMQFEPNAGLGLGVSLLLLVSWLFAPRRRPVNAQTFPQTMDEWHLALVRWTPFVCLLVYMIKLGLSTSGRIITPYYCLFLPFLLKSAGQEILVRRCWWKGLAAIVFLTAFIVVVINPPRPMWPARSILSRLSASHPQSHAITRGKMLYDSYAVRWDALGDVRKHFPLEEKNVGLISFVSSTTLETSLWRPFGQRRIWWLTPQMSLDEIRAKGIRYVVIGADSINVSAGDMAFSVWLQNWLQSHDAKIIGETRAWNVATKDPIPWFVIELPPIASVENK